MRRWMDPHTYGVIATLNLLVMYSTFSGLGTLSAAEVQLPYFKGNGDKQKFEKIRSTTFVFTLLTSIIFSIGVAFWAVAYRLHLDEYLFMGVLVYCFYLFANQISAYYITLLRVNHEFIFFAKYQFISGLLTCIGNVIAVWFYGFKGFLAVAIIVVLLQVFFLFKHVAYIPTFRVSWEEIKILISNGFPMLMIGLSTQGMKTIDNILVLNILDIENLGLYTIALMGSNIIYSATNSISNVLYPSMQEAYGKSGTSDILRTYIIRPSHVIATLLPVLIGILYFIIPMIVNWLIPKFEAGILAFKVMVISTYFFAMVNILSGYLISRGRQKILVLINVLILMLTIGIAIMINKLNWGVGGIAIATGIGYCAYYFVISVYVLRHWAGWDQTFTFLKETTLPFFFSLVLIFSIENFWPLAQIEDDLRILLTMLKLFIFIGLYAPCIFLFDNKTGIVSEFFVPIIKKKRNK